MSNYIYYAENVSGITYCHYDRSIVLDWYKFNDGTKIWTKTKDLYPTINVIIDKPNVDVDNIREEDDILNKTSIALRKAVAKYDKKNTKQVILKLNLETDKEILNMLDQVENKQGYIKELIKNDILRKKA